MCMIERIISVKFYFQPQNNSILVFDSGAEEIAIWDLVNGLKGLESWSLNEQLEIAKCCLQVFQEPYLD
jgi:hypothetical protein